MTIIFLYSDRKQALTTKGSNFRAGEMFRYKKSDAQDTTQKQSKLLKMDKKKLTVVLEVSSNLAIAYMKTKQYIKTNMMEVCEREKLSVEEYFISLFLFQMMVGYV